MYIIVDIKTTAAKKKGKGKAKDGASNDTISVLAKAKVCIV